MPEMSQHLRTLPSLLYSPAFCVMTRRLCSDAVFMLSPESSFVARKGTGLRCFVAGAFPDGLTAVPLPAAADLRRETTTFLCKWTPEYRKVEELLFPTNDPQWSYIGIFGSINSKPWVLYPDSGSSWFGLYKTSSFGAVRADQLVLFDRRPIKIYECRVA